MMMRISRKMRHTAKYTKKTKGAAMSSTKMPSIGFTANAEITNPSAPRASKTMTSTYSTLTTLVVTNDVNPKSNSEATNPFVSESCCDGGGYPVAPCPTPGPYCGCPGGPSAARVASSG